MGEGKTSLLDRIREALAERQRKAPRRGLMVRDEGESAPHRMVHTRKEKLLGIPPGFLQVPVKRAIPFDHRNKYKPKTASRSKEAAKAAKRAMMQP